MADATDLIEEYRTQRQTLRDTPPPRIVASATFERDGGGVETKTAVFDSAATLADVMVWSQNLTDSRHISDYLNPTGSVMRPIQLVLSPDLNSVSTPRKI